MQRDEPTLVEPLEDRLLRASFHPSDQGDALLATSLDAPDVRHRVLALRGLVRRGRMSDDLWVRVVREPDVEFLREVLLQLAHVPHVNRSLLDQVTQLLSSEDDLVVDAAAFALGEHLYPGALEALCVVASSHRDPRCRESAIGALGALGDDRARSTIFLALDDKPAIRRRAIVALANFEGPDVDAALDRASSDRDWQVRAAVTQLKNQER